MRGDAVKGDPVTGEQPRASILLVDDSQANLVALSSILEPLGQRLVLASSGREALRALLHEEFALILIDVRMGDMDGIETARLIRQRPRAEHVPIIFVTAFDRAETDVRAGYEVGAADFIFKPFQPEALRAKVSVFVELFQATEAVRRQAEQLRRMEHREHLRRLELAERGRRQAEARFANILDLAPDGIFALDAGDRVILFNKGAERLFGRSAGDVTGRPVTELMPGGLPGEGTAAEVVARRSDGSEFPAEVSVSRLTLGSEAITTAICRDITERRRAEDQVRALNEELSRRLRMGVDMVADLAGTLNPAEVMDRVMRRVVESVRADQGTLLRVEGGRFRVQGSHDLDGREAPPAGAAFPAFTVLRRALECRAPVLGGALDLRPATARVRGWLSGVEQTAALPLRLGDDIPAVLLLARRGRQPFGEREVETLELIGNVAAVALRNAQLFVQAEAASISKSEFLNMAAHELRTPLSVINGYLSMLSDGTLGPPGEAWRRPIEILAVKADELNKLVDGLLLAARMEAGTIQGQPEIIDLNRMACEALQRAEGRSRLLDADLILEGPDAPVLVQADPHHVARILDNLVNNALTYSKEKPWVKVTVTERAEVLVEDRGLGVPPDQQEAIFERFYRINDPSLPPQPGTGLGLYLSRELAERYGGSLMLDHSVPGRGSRFRLSLAAAAVDAAAQPLESLEAGGWRAGMGPESGGAPRTAS